MNFTALLAETLSKTFKLTFANYLAYFPGCLLAFVCLWWGDSGLVFLPVATACLAYAATKTLGPHRPIDHSFLTLMLAPHFILHLFAFFLYVFLLLLITAIVAAVGVSDEVEVVSSLALILLLLLSFRLWPLTVACYVVGLREWNPELLFKWMVFPYLRPVPLRKIWAWTRRVKLSALGWIPWAIVLVGCLSGYQYSATAENAFLSRFTSIFLSFALLPWLYTNLVYLARINLIATGQSPKFFFENQPGTFHDLESTVQEGMTFAGREVLEGALGGKLDYMEHLILPREEVAEATKDFLEFCRSDGYTQQSTQKNGKDIVTFFDSVASYRNDESPVAVAVIDGFTITLGVSRGRDRSYQMQFFDGRNKWKERYAVASESPLSKGLVEDTRQLIETLIGDLRS